MKTRICLFLMVGLLLLSCATQPPSKPVVLSSKGYSEHLEIRVKSDDPAVESLQFYQKTETGWSKVGKPSKTPGSARFWKEKNGSNSGLFAVKAMNEKGIESALSDSVSLAFRSLTDDDYLDMTQEAAFRFFYDAAHPVSGLTLERIPIDFPDIVTSGGTGMGLLAFPVAVERGWITRQQAIDHIKKMVDFLAKAERFHGAWSHWLNGKTGKAYPFSKKDNGADLVETAYLIQGLLTVRQYFTNEVPDEIYLRNKITELWESVEWDWFLRYPESKVLYWHWSPDYGWDMNFPLVNWNEVMITYLLAIASPTHGIPADCWEKGWQSGKHLNGKSFYDIKLEVGWDYGGPLFFTHYSFLGFDPRNKRDGLTNYFKNNRHVALIQQKYAVENPKGFKGYNAECWGLTASDNPWGYGAQEPFREDNGTITPTAALSSMPYVPELSLPTLKYFYHTYRDSLFGEFGFRDAFNPTENWFAKSVISIDQGPIVVMIENYRTQLPWKLFMANPEIEPMLKSIGFKEDRE